MNQRRYWGLTASQWLTVFVVVLLVILYLGYFGPDAIKAGIGFSENLRPLNPNEDLSRAKALWDWLQLLIVPLLLVAGGFFLNGLIENARQSIADQRAQDETLQAYLDQMGDLLLHKGLRQSLEDNTEVRIVARARTLTVLTGLDQKRKGRVMQFLDEASLITLGPPFPKPTITQLQTKKKPIISLNGADLRGADLSSYKLRDVWLRRVDLHGSNLHKTKLRRADLRHANLRGADLSEAFLGGANLSNADRSGAVLSRVADLSDVDLNGANLSNAKLNDAYKWSKGKDLWIKRKDRADNKDTPKPKLREVKPETELITNEELEQQGASLKGATMPNGQKYEDWLKSKGREEDGENSGP